MTSIEQCIELSAVEYQRLFSNLFHEHEDNIKDTVICAAIDVAFSLLKYENREDIYSTDPSHLTELKSCPIDSTVTHS